MKNKTLSRIVALALCVVMLLCFVACGANGGAGSYIEDGEDQSSDTIILGDGSTNGGMSSDSVLGGGYPAPPKEPGFEPSPAPVPFPYPDYEEVIAPVTPIGPETASIPYLPDTKSNNESHIIFTVEVHE